MINRTQPVSIMALRIVMVASCFMLLLLAGLTPIAAQVSTTPQTGTVSGALPPVLPPGLPPGGATLVVTAPGAYTITQTNNVATTIKSPYNVGAGNFTLGCFTNNGVMEVPTPQTFTVTLTATPSIGLTSFSCPPASDQIQFACAGPACVLLFTP